MVLHGALDPLVTQSDARQAGSVLGERGTLAITLQGSGHLPFLQQPIPFYQALSGLLETAEDAALASPEA
jgi:pimeloyl-ACP methyl ester carboxylesterase